MANIVVISGNLARDPMVSYSTGEKSTCTARFSVGVQRDFKNAEKQGLDMDELKTVISLGKH